MGIIKSIKTNHFEYMEKRGWEYTYWFLDIHATILVPNYQYGNTPKDFYPMAKETLQLMSGQNDIVLILYTCSHPHEIEEYLELFKSNDINFKYVNENPEVKTDLNGYGCYDKKPYINVLLDDKAGFNPEKDWKKINKLLTKKYKSMK